MSSMKTNMKLENCFHGGKQAKEKYFQGYLHTDKLGFIGLLINWEKSFSFIFFVCFDGKILFFFTKTRFFQELVSGDEL